MKIKCILAEAEETKLLPVRNKLGFELSWDLEKNVAKTCRIDDTLDHKSNLSIVLRYWQN